jgi:transcriptional regulator with XRE-family HTH domain
MKELVKTLVTEFSDKEYAHAYMEDFSNIAIAAQIKVLREQRDWTQKQLADAAEMKQERISVLEDVNYDAWTIKTLRKLAKAFDLTVKISFEKFSSGILDVSKMSSESLKRTSREDDLREFSCNGYRHEEILWGKTVKTAKASPFIAFTNNTAINDMEYRKVIRKVA